MSDFNSLEYTYSKGADLITQKLADVIEPADIWKTGKNLIISLAGVQKICNFSGIVEKKIQTEITPSEDNKQQHVVNIWVGFKGDVDPDNWARGSGEASKLNTGKYVRQNANNNIVYTDIGVIDAMYRYAMADKRAFCRAVLKLISLPGVYAEVEASSFQKNGGVEGNDF
jgi:hypothetical protein